MAIDLELLQRAVVLTNADGGKRRLLELRFAREQFKHLLAMRRVIAQEIRESGLLTLFAREALIMRRLGLRGQELKSEAQRSLEVLNGFQDELRRSEEMRKARQDFRRRTLQGFTLGAVVAGRAIGFDIASRNLGDLDPRRSKQVGAFELTDEELIAALEDRVVRYGAGITRATIEDARRIIRDEMYVAGRSIDDIAELIALDPTIPEWRALKIARTEVQESFQTARYEMHSRSGVRFHSWFTVGDRRVRTEHQDNDGVRRQVGKPFPSGQLHPGDNVGGLAINCRCSTFPDLSNTDIILQPWDGGGTMTLAGVI